MAKKMWAGRFEKATDKTVNDYNSSLPFDCRMYSQDIEGSIAHSAMLAKQGIITQDDADSIREGLLSIKEDIESGKLTFDSDAEVSPLIAPFIIKKALKPIASAKNNHFNIFWVLFNWSNEEFAINLLKRCDINKASWVKFVNYSNYLFSL